MNAEQAQTQCSSDPSCDARQNILDIARQLDRIGRDTEKFLCGQLEQLQRSIEEFEQEKAAWRRQIRRESSLLSSEREELDRLREQSGSRTSAAEQDPRILRSAAAEAAARKSGTTPLRLLLQPCAASPMQVGLLFFEISRLNRDMGGPGLQFEVADVRMQKKKMLSSFMDSESHTEIYEFHGFPTVPLKARGRHVSFDEDASDRVEVWISFKSQLLQSALADGDLATASRKSTPVKRNAETRSFILEATRRADPEQLRNLEPSGYSSALRFGRTRSDVVRQQQLRLENCCEKLCHDTGLRAQVEP